MTNQSCANQTRHVPAFIIAIAVLTLAFATSARPSPGLQPLQASRLGLSDLVT
jgi:hypothetical protein